MAHSRRSRHRKTQNPIAGPPQDGFFNRSILLEKYTERSEGLFNTPHLELPAAQSVRQLHGAPHALDVGDQPARLQQSRQARRVQVAERRVGDPRRPLRPPARRPPGRRSGRSRTAPSASAGSASGSHTRHRMAEFDQPVDHVGDLGVAQVGHVLLEGQAEHQDRSRTAQIARDPIGDEGGPCRR